MPHILLLKLRSVQTLWLFQLTMPHLSTVDREIPTWILKIGMHSFKSHCFSQVLKITVYFKLSSPPPCAKGGGGKPLPKQSKTFPSPHMSVHKLTREHLFLRASHQVNVNCLCQLSFSQVQGAGGVAQRYHTTVDIVPRWAAS